MQLDSNTPVTPRTPVTSKTSDAPEVTKKKKTSQEDEKTIIDPHDAVESVEEELNGTKEPIHSSHQIPREKDSSTPNIAENLLSNVVDHKNEPHINVNFTHRHEVLGQEGRILTKKQGGTLSPPQILARQTIDSIKLQLGEQKLQPTSNKGKKIIDIALKGAFEQAENAGMVPGLVKGLNEQLKQLYHAKGNEDSDANKDSVETKYANGIRDGMRSYTWKNYDVINNQKINETNPINFTKTENNKIKYQPMVFNNYGLHPDKNSEIEYYPSKVKITQTTYLKNKVGEFKPVKSCISNGKKYSFTEKDPLQALYDKKQGAIFLTSAGGNVENHDSFKIKELKDGSILIGVTDGCSWANATEAADQVAEQSCKNANERFLNCKNSTAALSELSKGVKATQEYSLNNIVGQDATMGQVYINKASRVGCAVTAGDTGVIRIRKTKEGFDCISLVNPVRLSPSPKDSGGRVTSSISDVSTNKKYDPELDKMEFSSWQSDKGDIIIVCSDGILDNLDIESDEGRQELNKALGEGAQLDQVMQKIKEIVLNKSEAKRNHYYTTGREDLDAPGKLDNAIFVGVQVE